MHKIGLMLRDNVHLWSFIENCTGNWGMSRNHWKIREFGVNSEEIREKLGNCVFLMGKQKSISPHQETGGKMRENCFTKILIWGIYDKQVGEMKGKWKRISFSPQVSIAQYCNIYWKSIFLMVLYKSFVKWNNHKLFRSHLFCQPPFSSPFATDSN